MDLIEFATDPRLLGLKLSAAQETLLRSIEGLPLTAAQLELWRLCTGREEYPGIPFGEATVIAGARSGKDSRIAAPIVCYEATFGGHEKRLSRGERGVIALVAQNQRASKIAFDFVRDYLMGSEVLRTLVAEVRAGEVELVNGITISCFACTQRSLRGWSIPVAVLDEVGFFRLEGSSDSDAEVQASVRRGMIAFEETKLIKISTPYMKGGVLYEDFRSYYGKDSADVLVWRAPSTLMNPTILEERLDRERRLDPSRFAREYEAAFVDDLEAFLPGAWVEDAVVAGRHELAPVAGCSYVGAVDLAGGGGDRSVIAIVHAEGEGADRRIVLDLVKGYGGRGHAVALEAMVHEMAEILARYGLRRVVGDRYAAAWTRQRFEAEGVTYEDASKSKSEAYLETEPFFAAGRIEILDHAELVRELKQLERRARSGGRTIVDHPSGGHDDLANALYLAAAALTKPRVVWGIADCGPSEPELNHARRIDLFGANRGAFGTRW